MNAKAPAGRLETGQAQVETTSPWTEADAARLRNVEQELFELRQKMRPYRGAPGKLVTLAEAAELLAAGGGPGSPPPIAVVDVGPPSLPEQYNDRSTVIVCPTRDRVDTRFIDATRAMISPMNAKRIELFARGFEVGHAYNRFISTILAHPHLKTWKYVLTIEDDNLPPPDGHIRLIEILEAHPELDAVAGLYHTKDATRTPMAYGDARVYRDTGVHTHEPLDRMLLDPDGPDVVEVLGIPMGFTLWRMDLFRQVEAPWFVTLADKILVDGDKLVDHDKITDEQAATAKRCMTQDLFFCYRAIIAGKRFAVAPSVAVGHLSLDDGMVY